MKKYLILVFGFIVNNVLSSNTNAGSKRMTPAQMMQLFKQQTNPEELKSLQKKATQILDEIKEQERERARKAAESICK